MLADLLEDFLTGLKFEFAFHTLCKTTYGEDDQYRRHDQMDGDHRKRNERCVAVADPVVNSDKGEKRPYQKDEYKEDENDRMRGNAVGTEEIERGVKSRQGRVH